MPDYQQLHDDWERYINRFGELAKHESKRLHRLFKQSDERLAPLSDPLGIEFANHRWLDREREESYSGWLAWLIRRMQPIEVLRLFGIEETAFAKAVRSSKITDVSREEWITGGESRLDVVIRLENEAVLLVEVKIRSLDEAGGRDNLPAYLSWLKSQQPKADFRQAVLLLPDPSEASDFARWHLQSWEGVTLELRHQAWGLCTKRRDLLNAAMLLALAGAVEQNVLNLSDSPPQAAAYLDRWLGGNV